jgi:hypothetical protein
MRWRATASTSPAFRLAGYSETSVARKVARVEPCDSAQARARLRDAQAQLDLAEIAGVNSRAEERKAAASCAVVAGVAAADAACCAALGQRSRGQDHRQASDLLRRIEPGGDQAARHFGRLIGLKDAAQYGFDDLSGAMLTAVQRQAKALVDFAVDVTAR